MTTLALNNTHDITLQQLLKNLGTKDFYILNKNRELFYKLSAFISNILGIQPMQNTTGIGFRLNQEFAINRFAVDAKTFPLFDSKLNEHIVNYFSRANFKTDFLTKNDSLHYHIMKSAKNIGVQTNRGHANVILVNTKNVSNLTNKEFDDKISFGIIEDVIINFIPFTILYTNCICEHSYIIGYKGIDNIDVGAVFIPYQLYANGQTKFDMFIDFDYFKRLKMI